jgi:hypothetical protein
MIDGPGSGDTGGGGIAFDGGGAAGEGSTVAAVGVAAAPDGCVGPCVPEQAATQAAAASAAHAQLHGTLNGARTNPPTPATLPPDAPSISQQTADQLKNARPRRSWPSVRSVTSFDVKQLGSAQGNCQAHGKEMAADCGETSPKVLEVLS